MSNLADLSGEYFGYWKVIERYGITKSGNATWLCECQLCNKRKIVLGKNLKNSKSKSCGCRRANQQKERAETHGMSGTRLHRIWGHMIQRTTNVNDKAFEYYGGRGIEVCEEWRNSFETFEEWAKENGYAENLTIDRIDNNKGYYPDNCRWVTRRIQSRNTRRNHYLTYNDQTKTIAEWENDTGIKKGTLLRRIEKLGWDIEKALTTKVKTQKQTTK